MSEEDLQTRIDEAYEVYAGMEAGIPETAYEGYLLKVIEDMIKALKPWVTD